VGFKTDTSFLRFLSMGAIGVRQTIRQLDDMGFQAIELERYCGSNKIWTTKVKRLRLPDLLCVRTGLRIEVRAKSDLKIRMSDAPNNPDRRWDTGNRDDDLVALITSFDGPNGPESAREAVFFTFAALRASVDTAKLGPPKSASEGAERDRTWPAVIPSRDGVVLAVDNQRISVQMEGDGQPPRKQTYTLNGKKAYVSPGDRFVGKASIVAGTPDALADVSACLRQTYDPLAETLSINAVDRYAAAKALPHRDDLRQRAVTALESLITRETDQRVHLEAAGSAAALGSGLGEERIRAILHDGNPEMRMEAAFILTELNNAFAKTELAAIAGSQDLAGNELRQAAVWGLGKTGLKAYRDILPFIDDEDENLALHAIAGFGEDTPDDVTNALVRDLLTGSPRRAASASETLRIINNATVLESLIAAAETGASGREWIVATLGRLPATIVKERLQGESLLGEIKPLLLLSEEENWLCSEERSMDVSFLLKQNI
jgi:hypothetical protein